MLAPDMDHSLIELHISSDASKVGYGVVAYSRCYVVGEEACCRVILAKARVAPLKVQTIPRLKLTAAVLAACVGSQLQTELNREFADVVFWTDSMTVLNYIRNESYQFKTFVANRISTIHSLTKVNQWRYVPSNQNVADYVSRGIRFSEDDIKIWREGPGFLKRSKEFWSTTKIECITTQLELKESVGVHLVADEPGMHQLVSYYSDWKRLLKALAWLSRYKCYPLMTYCGRTDITLRLGLLNVEEIDLACMDLIRFVQCRVSEKEVRMLQSSGSKSKMKAIGSPLRKLNPILLDGLLCVGGRLQGTAWCETRKHPIILPSKHLVADLILQHYYKTEGHVGSTQVMATVRERFWVLRGGTAVRRIVGNCIHCRRRNARPAQQLMAPMPLVRVGDGEFPFLSLGVDYFGPLTVKQADSEDLEVLTPAKLLLLRENVTNFSDLPLSNKYSRRWQQASYLAKVFWKRWSREYVSLLQQRHKWTKLERNLREGDLVVICSDFREKDKWPLGLVQRAIQGKDGQ
ncbi:Gag-Pol polyprotein, partial [Schistosoma japonicum]